MSPPKVSAKPASERQPHPTRTASDKVRAASPPPPQRPAPPKREVVGWLVNKLLPPVPIHAGQEAVVGRSDQCQLVLAHAGVSRRHAAVKADGARFVIQDLGSANGTFVNARRISAPTPIRAGDAIGVGPFMLTIAPGSVRRSTDEISLANLTETAQLPATPEAELEGRLGTLSLAEILQTVELYGKTGTLEVETREARGVVIVVAGRPIRASFGRERDENAVRRLLRLQAGKFQFHARVEQPVPPASMTMGLSALVLEAARDDDERRRASEPEVEDQARSFFELKPFPTPPPDPCEVTRPLPRTLASCPGCDEPVDPLRSPVCPSCGRSTRDLRP